jgi:methyl-accepting chemotaxis protein
MGQNGEIAKKVTELIGEIAAASREQAQGISQVNSAVVEMDKVAQQTAASAEESASAAEELNAQAEQMKSYVGDLVILIGGEDQGAAPAPVSHKVVRKALQRGRSVKSTSLVRHDRKAGGTSGKEKVVRPDQIIPLGDDDFKDF